MGRDRGIIFLAGASSCLFAAVTAAAVANASGADAPSRNSRLAPLLSNGYVLGCGLALAATASVLGGVLTAPSRRKSPGQSRATHSSSRVSSLTSELSQANLLPGNLLQVLLDNCPDHIYFKDRTSRFVCYSRSFKELLHLDDTNLLRGKTDFDFFAEEHAQVAYDDEQEIIRSGRPVIGKIEKETHVDGRVTWSLTTKLPWRDAAGETIGTFGISRDFTAQKEAEAKLAYERELFRTLVENIPDAIYFKDRASRFVKLSTSKVERARQVLLERHRTARSAAGHEPLPAHLTDSEHCAEYLLGKTDFDLESPERAQAAYDEEQEILRTGRSLIGKIERWKNSDGSMRWMLTTKMPWRDPDGGIIGTFGLTRDITALKEAEAKLEDASRQLARTSRQAGMAEVATDVLHNVGNVLNSVNVSCSLVIDRVQESNYENVTKIPALLRTHAGRLDEFFATDPRGSRLLDYLAVVGEDLAAQRAFVLEELKQLRNHIDHIKRTVAMQQSYAKVAGVSEAVSAEKLVEDALQINACALDRHSVILRREFEPAPEMLVDKHKMLQILVNLVSNAKYAVSDSPAADKCITVRIRPEEPGRIVIQVADNGIGISPENLTRIFAHGFTTRKDGHGFGLHSGALAARELGGELSAYSDGLGPGCHIYLTASVAAAFNGHRMKAIPRILVVDDNTAIHDDFRKILGDPASAPSRRQELEQVLFGANEAASAAVAFRLDYAHQGQEALQKVREALATGDPFAMAFVDVRMPPGWDGIETLEQIWKHAPELQAVICTAFSDYSWDNIRLRLGRSESLIILKKPFETIEVLQLAHAMTRKWELSRQARLRMEDLDRLVQERTRELVIANGKLREEIAERARIQQALRVSEERFSKAFHTSPLAMAIQDQARGRFLDANASFIQLTGFTGRELLDFTAVELGLWADNTADKLASIHAGQHLRNRSCLVQARDGTRRDALLWAEPIALDAGPCLLLIVEDVTDQLRLESQLRQAQKMEAVGRLGAGIAHEFNNILTVIQGHAELLRDSPADSRMVAESATRISRASQRAAALTRQLLAFSRKQPMHLKSVDLSAVVRSTQKLLDQLLGECYELQLHCAEDLPPLLADEGSLEQILMNLGLNARDAMPGGGVIRIETSLEMLEEPTEGRKPDARPGPFLVLSVTDTGCGMKKETLDRIFDPFFTTKELGKGTGLGLSTVLGIVRQHQGWIEVSSEVGQGTTFKLYLPVADPTTAPAAAIEASRELLPRSGNGEAVLIVEDEDGVRHLARATLERAGYTVFEASDGQSALELWKRSPIPIALLVTDMVLPRGMNGGKLAQILREQDRNLRVIYISGYGSEIIKDDLPARISPGLNFLPKPFEPHSLFRAVRSSLGGGKESEDDPSLVLA